ncbi:MAG TPA: GNAT family N-acetyltransferase [Pseudonocardiaceae bacterium]|jgi:GNAT superfamily N-acetyltransferase|nr:GNAT family N-acetyltransferase [Pseudonocardiaceae bacterium]
MDELIALYREVYAEPPYEWGVEQSELFSDPFARQRRSAGFSLVEARCGDQLVAYGFGVPLAPTTTWWQRLDTPLPEALTREYPGRTFALVELLVRRPWRRKHVAETLHARLLQERQEERATLLALPAADAAQAAYAKWGWCKVAQKRNPVPGSPVFDVMVKELGNLRHLRCAPAGP